MNSPDVLQSWQDFLNFNLLNTDFTSSEVEDDAQVIEKEDLSPQSETSNSECWRIEKIAPHIIAVYGIGFGKNLCSKSPKNIDLSQEFTLVKTHVYNIQLCVASKISFIAQDLIINGSLNLSN